ncbi:hypothetical protein KA977_01265 [Candidatus Dependentiae bacterium]|nr:hypothetical protein [Candidatus Dependentiae bacterium]
MSIQEEIISKIIEETGSTRKIAELALTLSNQKIETAINIIKTKVAVIQGRIIAENAEISGLFIIKFFQKNNFINPVFLFTRDDEILNLNITGDFNEFEVFIKKRRIFLDEFLSNLSEKLGGLVSQNQKIKNILEIFNNNFTEIFCDNTLENLIVALIKNQFDNNVLIDTDKKIYSQAEYEFLLMNRDVSGNEEDEREPENYENPVLPESIGESGDKISSEDPFLKQAKDIFLKCEEIMNDLDARSNFKIVSELAVGDKIMVKLIDTTPQSNYIFNIMKLNQFKVINDNIETKIIKIDKNEKDYFNITTELIPGIYTKLRLNPSNKIMTNDNLTSSKTSSIIILILCLLFMLFMIYYFIEYIKK